MSAHALALGHDADGVVVLARAAAEAAGLLEDLVGVLPVVTLEAHLLRPHGDDLPVRHGLAGGIVELLIQTHAALAVGPGEILLTPGGGGQHDVRVLAADGVAKIDVLIHQHHTAAVHALFQRIDDGLLVEGVDPVAVLLDQA